MSGSSAYHDANHPGGPGAALPGAFASIRQAVDVPQTSTLGYLFVLSVPLVAGLGCVRGVKIGEFNYTGFLWLATLIIGVVLIVVEKGLHSENLICLPCVPWLIWGTYLWLSALWCRNFALVPNVQDMLQLSMPLVVGIAASLFIRTEKQLKTIMRVFGVTLGLLALFVVTMRSGAESRSEVVFAERGMATTAVAIGCVMLAGAPAKTARAFVGWSICVLLTVVTGGRMATAALLALPILHPLYRHPVRKAILVIGMVGIALLLLKTPILQERFFGSDKGSASDIFEGRVEGTGRFMAWPQIYEEAWKRPVLGAGAGTVGEFVPLVWPQSSHAHNDYLRLFFELGAIGLVLFLLAVVWQLFELRRQIRRSQGVVQQAFVAAQLGLIAFLILAATDNPLIYNLLFTDPLFVVMGAAYGVSRGNDKSDDVSGWLAEQEKLDEEYL